MKDNVIQTYTPNIIDQIAQSASRALHSTQQVADDTLDGIDHKVEELRGQVSPRLDHAKQQADAMARQSLQSARDTTRRLRDTAVQVSDGTVQYVRDEPLKSVLIAAATGALLMGLASLLARSGR